MAAILATGAVNPTSANTFEDFGGVAYGKGDPIFAEDARRFRRKHNTRDEAAEPGGSIIDAAVGGLGSQILRANDIGMCALTIVLACP